MTLPLALALAALLLLDLLAWRYGVDTRDGRDWHWDKPSEDQ